MSTYLGWNVVFIPAYPPAPASIEVSQVDPAAMNTSPFTGQQQIQSWGSTWMEGVVTMPAMKLSDGQNWVQFLRQLQGRANVFQFTAAFVAKYPELGTTTYWRLKNSARKWSITPGGIYGMSFEIVEAL